MSSTHSKFIHTLDRANPFARNVPSRDEIVQRAYEIYVRNGSRPELADQNWFLAQRELFMESLSTQGSAAANPAEDAQATTTPVCDEFRPTRLCTAPTVPHAGSLSHLGRTAILS